MVSYEVYMLTIFKHVEWLSYNLPLSESIASSSSKYFAILVFNQHTYEYQRLAISDVALSKFLNANRVLGLNNNCSDLHVTCDLQVTSQ